MNVRHNKDGSVDVLRQPGMWTSYPTPLAAVVGECRFKLGLHKGRAGDLMDAQSRKELKLDAASLSRVNNGKQAMPQVWLLRFHVWAALPIADLEKLAGIESDIQPHPNLRKELK